MGGSGGSIRGERGREKITATLDCWLFPQLLNAHVYLHCQLGTMLVQVNYPPVHFLSPVRIAMPSLMEGVCLLPVMRQSIIVRRWRRQCNHRAPV